MEKFIVVTKNTGIYFLSNGKTVMGIDPENGEVWFQKPETFEKVYGDEEKILITKRDGGVRVRYSFLHHKA